MEGREVVIVEAARTPVGRGHPEKGYYRHVHANALLGSCYRAVVERAGIDPLVIGKSPVTQLNAVVLPAPFGPIIERISPRSRLKLTSETASSPPNRLVTWSSSSSANSGDSLHRGQRFALTAALELDTARAAG